MDYPKISIITPSFNQGRYIERTIETIISQNYPNLEYMIIDGGSTDDTISIIKKYEKYITFWVSEKDKGQSNALNKGFSRISGKIVGWLNSDDWYEKNTFENIANIFSDPKISVIAGNCKMIFENTPEKDFVDKPGEITFKRLTQYWKPFFCPPQPSIFFRKEVLDKVGLLDESLIYGMDLDLWLRISKQYKIKYVNKLLSNYLIHANSKSGSDDGFSKFMPEWKKVVDTNLKDVSFLRKFFFKP